MTKRERQALLAFAPCLRAEVPWICTVRVGQSVLDIMFETDDIGLSSVEFADIAESLAYDGTEVRR